MKPVLKWVGGKSQILDTILSEFPRSLNNYHEPFIGGGSVLLGLLSLIKEGHIKLSGKVYASDKNDALIGVYHNIQQRADELIVELSKLVKKYLNISGECEVGFTLNRNPIDEEEGLECKEQYYYWLRRVYNNMSKEEKCSCKGAAHFIFLNKTCFRGIYREGPNGFNVPYGNYKNPSIYDEEHIKGISSLIQDVVFRCQGFERSLEYVMEKDFVYMDPPYAPETSKSFVSYTSDGFSRDMHDKLFKLCDNMTHMNNVNFMMSNADVEQVRKCFPSDKYKIQVISCKRSINSKKPDSKTNEVIVKWV